MKPKLVIKAFNKDYKEIPFAIEDDDFTVKIPEDCTLQPVVKFTISKVDVPTSSPTFGVFSVCKHGIPKESTCSMCNFESFEKDQK